MMGLMKITEVPSHAVAVEQAHRAAVARATHPFLMAVTHAWGASGTHVFTRHPDLPLSLCGEVTRPTRSQAALPLLLRVVTCLPCLAEFARRVSPQ